MRQGWRSMVGAPFRTICGRRRILPRHRASFFERCQPRLALLEHARTLFLFRVPGRQFAILPDHAVAEDHQQRARKQDVGQER
jgi:hypothetical protein